MNKAIYIIIVLILTMTLGQSIRALEPHIVYDLIEQGSQLKATKNAAASHIFELKSEYGLDGPQLEYEHLWAKNGLRKWSLGLTQNFQWPGVYSVKNQVIKGNLQLAFLQERALCLNLKLQATDLLIEIAFNRQKIDILTGMLDDMWQLSDNLDTALRYGLVTILDKKKAAIEAVDLSIQCDALLARQAELQTQLEQIVGQSLDFNTDDSLAVPPVGPLLDRDDYIRNIETDPGLAALISEATLSELGLKEMRMSAMPGLGVGYRYENEEGIGFKGFALSLNLPKWNVANVRKAATTLTLSNQAKIDALRNEQIVRVENEYRSALSLRDKIEKLHANGIDGTYLTLLKEARQGGEISILDYLREQTYYRSVTLNLLDIKTTYTKLLSSLNRNRLL